jgi:hypothetical protein
MNSANWRLLSNGWVLTLMICLAANTIASAQVWTRAASFGGVGSDLGASIRITSNGDRYLTGSFSDSVSFGKETLVSSGDTDVFLAKSGQWAVQIGGAAHDEGTDVAFDSAGNVYVTGWFTDSATFHSTHGSPVTVTGGFGETIFLAKYSSPGVLVWVQTGISDTFGIVRGHGVAVDSASGAVYLTGITQDPTLFSSANGSSSTIPGPWFWHMYLVKYDADGDLLWGEWNEAAPNSVPY